MITNPPLNQNKTEGDIVSFVCEGEGTPGNLSVAWYRDNTPIMRVSSMQGRVNTKPGSTNLIINPVKAEDAGTYVCELTNGIGRPQRASANLEVTCKYKYKLYSSYLLDNKMATSISLSIQLQNNFEFSHSSHLPENSDVTIFESCTLTFSAQMSSYVIHFQWTFQY